MEVSGFSLSINHGLGQASIPHSASPSGKEGPVNGRSQVGCTLLFQPPWL